jgi:hypothetical protein
MLILVNWPKTYDVKLLVFYSGTSADDLFPLFDKYGKVVDIFIPRDRRYDYDVQICHCSCISLNYYVTFFSLYQDW